MALFSKQKKQKQPKQKTVTAKQAANDFVKAAKEFEQSRIGDIERSRTVAWRVAIGACVVAIVCAVALMMLTPFKEVRPYVIRVDNNTGKTDIVTMLSNEQSEYGEQVAKYFSAMYVDLMESYDWYTVQKQIDNALLFSDANMQNKILNKYKKVNAPHKVYKDKQRITIKITNATLIDEKGLMQVRFVKSVEPVNGGTYNPQENATFPKPIVTNHIATLGYEYVNVPTLDDIRLVNPLGFTVKTYRVDDVIAK